MKCVNILQDMEIKKTWVWITVLKRIPIFQFCKVLQATEEWQYIVKLFDFLNFKMVISCCVFCEQETHGIY